MFRKEAGKTTLKIVTGMVLKTAAASTSGNVIKFVLFLCFKSSFLTLDPQAISDQVSSRRSSPKSGNKDHSPVPGEMGIRIVARNQDTKARQLEAQCN